MRRIGTVVSLLLILPLILSVGSLIIKPAAAQSTPKPAVPQFSIQYVDYSYDIPATNSTDPYTGQQILHPSRHIGDIRIEGKIKNQPFTRYTLENPNGTGTVDIGFYYNVRYKGHFGEEWTEIYGYHNKDYISQNYGSEDTNFTIYWQEFPEGAQIDYQVKSIIGYESRTYIGPYPKPIIIGEESGWSNTLTLIFTKNETANGNSFASNIDIAPYPSLLPVSTSTPSPSPSPTPTVPELSWLAILPLLLSVFSVAVLLRYQKVKKP